MSETLQADQQQFTEGRYGLRIPVPAPSPDKWDVGKFFNDFYKLNNGVPRFGVSEPGRAFVIPATDGKPFVMLNGSEIFVEPDEPGQLVPFLRFSTSPRGLWDATPHVRYRGKSLLSEDVLEDFEYNMREKEGFEDFESLFSDEKYGQFISLYPIAAARAALKDTVELLS
jgi:hypothetical protein